MKGEISLTAIVLLTLGIGVGIAVYDNPRLGGAIIAAVVVVTLVYTLLRQSDSKTGGRDAGGATGPGGNPTASGKAAAPDPES